MKDGNEDSTHAHEAEMYIFMEEGRLLLNLIEQVLQCD